MLVIGFCIHRDRTPFVLTSDMAYVINGGDKPSAKFHHFVDLCCTAFNVVRRHGSLLLNLFGLVRTDYYFFNETSYKLLQFYGWHIFLLETL